MRAMLLAAGKGIRLGEPGLSTPKALMPVLGVPLLSRLLALLHRGGVKEVAMNAYHLAEQLEDYLRDPRLPFRVRLFREHILLDSGGALMNAADFWREDSLLIWNADTISDVSLCQLEHVHQQSEALATLLVQERSSSSYLLIDDKDCLCGLDSSRRQQRGLYTEPKGDTHQVAYNGIAMLRPRLRDFFPSAGEPFDFIQALLDAVSRGATVQTFQPQGIFYAAIDTVAKLEQLEKCLRLEPHIRLAFEPYD